ncbi:hypothetical protein D3C75_730640 [compost metagenome]
MQRSHTIHAVAGYNRQMGHAHLIVMNNGHLVNPVLIARIFAHQLAAEAGVDLLNNEEDARQQLPHHANRPFLQRFAENGVVGVGDHPGGHAPGLIPAESVHIHQYPHQLRNDQCGMRIVDMQSHFVRQ